MKEAVRATTLIPLCSAHVLPFKASTLHVGAVRSRTNKHRHRFHAFGGGRKAKEDVRIERGRGVEGEFFRAYLLTCVYG